MEIIYFLYQFCDTVCVVSLITIQLFLINAGGGWVAAPALSGYTLRLILTITIPGDAASIGEE